MTLENLFQVEVLFLFKIKLGAAKTPRLLRVKE